MNNKYFRQLINVLMFLVLISIIIYAEIDGKIGATKKNGEGCDCHGDLDTTVFVKIDGPEEIKLNETADYSVTITGGPMKKAGTNIAVTSGTLTAGPDLYLKRKELTHSEPKNPTEGKVVFKFKYTAPNKPEEIIIFANGNSVNNNETKHGDAWNFAPNKIVKVNDKEK